MGDLMLWTQHTLEMWSDFMRPLLFWNRPTWTIDHLPDVTGQLVIVTGGNSGTGYCTTRLCTGFDAKVYMGRRNETRARVAMDRIERDLPCEGAYVARGMDEWHRRDLLLSKSKGQLESLQLDLEDLDSVKAASEHILRNEQRPDRLYANAGILMTPPGQYTKQGHSLQYGTDRISRVNPESPARVVILSSAGHSMAPKCGVDYGALCRPAEGDTEAPCTLDRMAEYGMSKWGHVVLAQHINEHYSPRSNTKDGEVLAFAVHPGIVATNLSAHLSGLFMIIISVIASFAMFPRETGTINQLWVGTMPAKAARKISGEYITPHQRIGMARPDLRNHEAVERVWNCYEQEGKKHA